jgi:hypothetical protein
MILVPSSKTSTGEDSEPDNCFPASLRINYPSGNFGVSILSKRQNESSRTSLTLRRFEDFPKRRNDELRER